MKTTRARPRRILPLVLLAGGAGLLGACVQIPDSGPVETADSRIKPLPGAQQVAVPRGPQPGLSPEETVDDFLAAMLARPMSAAVAREFLTGTGASGWRPEQGFVTYDDKSSPAGEERLRVTLTGVNRFDSRGAWLGAPPNGTSTLDFSMTTEGGEWRIAGAQDALVVSSDWFEENTTPLSLYFFDPQATTLVPEPVFVADGEQMPTMLVRGLLDGPAEPRVERSFVPQGLSLSLSVIVNEEGVASIPLEGGAGPLSGEAVDRMAAQFAWTLRQVPSVGSMRITLDGEPLALSSGDTEFDVGLGSAYDPTGTLAREELYGLLDGGAVRVVGDEIDPLAGPFGTRRLGLRDLSVDLAGRDIAGVTADGRVLLSSVAGGSEVSTLVRGRDVLHPAWDLSQRLWVVDRRAGRAVVWTRPGGTSATAARIVNVPGVSGRDVVDFLVSRDGTRLIAAVRGAAADRIVATRIAGGEGTPRAVGSRVIVRGEVAQGLRVQDLGWRSATAIYYLRAAGGRQSELHTAIVDGAPTEFDPEAFPGVLASQNVRVVSSPRPDEPVYLQRVGGGFSEVTPESPALTTTSRVTSLVYVG